MNQSMKRVTTASRSVSNLPGILQRTMMITPSHTWNLPDTHQSFDISGYSKKAITWALAPTYSVQMQAKVSMQVSLPTQCTKTPPLRAVYFGEGRILISTKGYASALEWSKADANTCRIR